MGILPLEYVAGENRESLGLSGEETFAISGIATKLEPRMTVEVTATASGGAVRTFRALVRIDTPDEAEYYRHGGILPYVLRQVALA
jgi:aconitate hydratase